MEIIYKLGVPTFSWYENQLQTWRSHLQLVWETITNWAFPLSAGMEVPMGTPWMREREILFISLSNTERYFLYLSPRERERDTLFFFLSERERYYLYRSLREREILSISLSERERYSLYPTPRERDTLYTSLPERERDTLYISLREREIFPICFS